MTIAREKLADIEYHAINFPSANVLRADARTMVELLVSILDYVEGFQDVDPHLEDGRVDPIMIGIKMAMSDLRQRFDLFAAGQPIVIPPVTS